MTRPASPSSMVRKPTDLPVRDAACENDPHCPCWESLNQREYWCGPCRARATKSEPPTAPVGQTPGPWHVELSDDDETAEIRSSAAPQSGTLIATVYRQGSVGHGNARVIWNACNHHAALVSTLLGCADALKEAGKDFALANPRAVRPNLYELHEQTARALLAAVEKGE